MGQPANDPLFMGFQGALVGRYSLDREIGRGGMGIVYLAHEVHLDRLVAIKLLPPERARSQPELRDRFLREARLAARLSHPNIIPIHAVEETGGFVYYVMAYVDGESLAERVIARGPLPANEATRVLHEVAWALSYAHEHGVVHRDIKPDNVLIERSSGRVLVADFGIAAAAGEPATAGVAGTPEFMSPEQVLGQGVDARSDIYALGATAYYVCSGRLPIEGATKTETLARQISDSPAPLASVGVNVPRRLANLVDRCLMKDPGNRPVDARSVAQALGLAMERRRDLPPALRAFVKRGGRLNSGGTIIVLMGMLPASVATASYWGAAAGFGTFALLGIAAPAIYLIGAARSLLRQGFAYPDLDAGFRAELQQASEELVPTRGRFLLAAERVARVVTKTAAATFAVTLPLTVIRPTWFFIHRLTGFDIGNLMAWSISAATFGALAYVALRQRHRDVDGEIWSRFWTGRIGKALFAIARKLRGKRTAQGAVTHRATELSLGLAAGELYESLTREQRTALAGVPALLERLQSDAQTLRRRHEDMQEALDSVGDRSSGEYAAARSLCDEVRGKLGEAVGALETIRLNLLRLHAGSVTVQSITTHLDVAAELSNEVERLISAHHEIARVLQFPRTPASTPA